MRKNIDFHIHTKRTLLDSEDFEFDIDFLKNHVEHNSLDAIAITNHNCFNKEQYLYIQNELSEIIAFPGVEVSIEGGHMLVISPIDKMDELHDAASELSSKITTQESTITFEEFENIFPNYVEYLLIPHIDTKKPILKSAIIEKFGDEIIAGEVRNYKKFLTYKKTTDNLTPVVFSDERMFYRDKKEHYNFYSIKHTKIDVDELTIDKIKIALTDKSKVHIVNFEDSEFEYMPLLQDGTFISNKLNLVVGKRSTGKTTVLRQIEKNFNERYDDGVKFIEQFQITTESETKNFNKIINNLSDKLNKNYYDKYQAIVNNMIGVNLRKHEQNFNAYFDSLISFADNEDRTNQYSTSKLYNEVEYSIKKDDSIKELVSSVKNLIKNNDYKGLIEKHINKDVLINLYNDLQQKHKELFVEMKLKGVINDYIKDVQKALSDEGGVAPIKNINYKDYFIAKTKVNKFNGLSEIIKGNEIIDEKQVYRFKIISNKSKLDSISELKETFKTRAPLTDALDQYENNNIYQYMMILQTLGAETALIHKMLFYQETNIVNERDKNISHGERAEFNLLRHLEDAKTYDIVLFDEPEASFDNFFINDEIINILKDISKTTTIVVTTHNNNLGSSSESDYIIYTDFEHIEETNNTEYNVYSGSFDSTELKTADGKRIKTYDVLMETMEANKDAYDERKRLYENFKNRR